MLEAYFLVGPTAVGKSAVAHYLAEQHGYDLISMDSMMVYRGMDIGTAKPSHDDRRRFRYQGLDLVDPDQPFSVAQYILAVVPGIRSSLERGIPVLAVGGTGLYIQALLHGLREVAPADEALRIHWKGRIAIEGIGCLQKELERRDPVAFAAMPDKANERRLIRVLERALHPVTELTEKWISAAERGRVVGLRMPTDALNRRIELRAEDMYRLGLLDEVRCLLSRFEALSPTANQAIGYAEAIDVIREHVDVRDALTRTVTRTRQLAKRQRTWFRHQARVEWIDVEEPADVAVTAARVKAMWDKHGPTRIRVKDVSPVA